MIKQKYLSSKAVEIGGNGKRDDADRNRQKPFRANKQARN